jgi:hypothetical protein
VFYFIVELNEPLSSEVAVSDCEHIAMTTDLAGLKQELVEVKVDPDAVKTELYSVHHSRSWRFTWY